LTLLHTLHPVAERGGGATKSDCGGNGAGAPKTTEDAGGILGEAVVTAVYLQNRLLTKSLAGRTPYEAWHGRKPAVNHLRVFSCRAFVKQLGHVDKLTDQSRVGVFIIYTEGAKAYRILNPAARQVCTARDVVFDEAHGWDWTATTGASPAADFTVEYIYAGAS
jgi:hypothetical protein